MTSRSRNEAPPVPSVESGASSFGACGNCGAQLNGPFCSQCGEKKVSPKDYTLRHFIEESLGELTYFDNRFLRTVRLLFTKPGQLSNAYFYGGRSRYTRPLTLFVIINVIFFFVQPHTGLFGYKYVQYMNDRAHLAAVQAHLRQTGESQQSYMARFDANLQNQKKSLLIVAVPVLALFMSLLFAGSGRTYAEHLVFSVQVYAFLLAYLAGVVLLLLVPLEMALGAVGPAAGPVMRSLETERAIDAILLAGVAVYMYFGFRRAYRASRIHAAASAMVLTVTVAYLIGLYHTGLFYVTFWTT